MCSIVMLMSAVVGLLVKYRKARASGQEVSAGTPTAGQPIIAPNYGNDDSWKDLSLPCVAIGLAAFTVWLLGLVGAWGSQWFPGASATLMATMVSSVAAFFAGLFLGSFSTEIETSRASIPTPARAALLLTATVSAVGLGALVTSTEHLYGSVGDVMEAGIPLAAGIIAFVIGRWWS